MIKFALLGVICASNGLAVFRDADRTTNLRVGQQIEGFTLAAIEPRRVVLTKSGAMFYLYTGDIYIDEPVPTIRKGIEQRGDVIRISEQLKRYIAKDGLVTVLMQAYTEVTRDSEGGIVGFSISQIDAGSVYELAGLIDGDIITEIDGVKLDSPFVALRSLMRVRDLPEFSFRLIRDGLSIYRTIIVH